MKRFFPYLFICLFFYLLIVRPFPVQADCSFNAYGCGGSCSCDAGYTGTCSCVNYYGYCVAWGNCQPNPTSPPTCLPPDCSGKRLADCSGGSFNICTQNDFCQSSWRCTGTVGTCSTWSAWSACYPAPDCVNTRYCTNGTAQPQAQSCTDGAGCGGGGPTATPVPTDSPPTPTSTPTPTPTIVQAPWIKLKNTSFISQNSLTSMIPLVPVAYDGDDSPADTYFIRDAAGLVAAPAINIATKNSNAKTGSPEYKDTGYSSSYLMIPGSFLSYINARKQHKVITSLEQITADGIYVWDKAVSFPDIDDTTTIPGFNFVLISTIQAITISRTNFTPSKSVAIVANSITFGDSAQTANGVFIAQTINTGSNGNLGLKIKGNLIALTTLTNGRTWSDTSRPSVFIVFDPVKYINLLPYLSTTSYQWRQIQ